MPRITKLRDREASKMLDDYLNGRKLSDLIDVAIGFDKNGHIKMIYTETKLSDIINEILNKYCNNEEFLLFKDVFEKFIEDYKWEE